ncbi:MAG TPA: hypothetical protein ENK85_02480 [Saprospiraceae bacterium]|nr:hypothetical protein [Saprospiraceae bacterium]
MRKKSKILARYIYPKPKGIALYPENLNREEAVVQLFAACRSLQGVIYAKGWEFLGQRYGLEKLYEIDRKSGWFGSKNEKEWLEAILDWALISGFNFQTRHFGVYDKSKNLFRTDDGRLEVIDFDYFTRSFKK